MYSFQFENSIILNSISENRIDFNKGLFLWILHANKIPPHIGISLDGIYFSLKVNGKDDGIELTKINKIIEAKKIGTFIVEINQEVEINDLKYCFSKHNKVVSNHTTCLTPIQDVLKLEGEKLILSELLNKIQLNDSLGKVFSLNLESDFKGILAYGKAEIENRLKLLENVKRNKSIH
ncbi:MAG: hypothetical protein LW701_07745 [Fluviicola sp.]|nr:hypothetical protein [Fluviicola sp.]